ncbi:MAG: phage holin family protein [Chloroflexi bacterium]|nr:phage holin family protein [Chloroflexota bacterium]
MKRSRGQRLIRFLLRALFILLVHMFALGVMAEVLPGLSMKTWETDMWGVVVIALLNALLRPILLFFTLPFAVLTFGLWTLVLNGGMIMLASREIVPGFTVDNWGVAIVAALGLAAINTTITALLSLNEEDSFYHNMVRRLARRSAPPDGSDKPGLIFIEIDGLAESILQQAIRDGYMPHLAQWLESGSHRVVDWDCGVPSQTSSSQAGILCGSNFDIPAFRWYEKDHRRLMVSSHPADAAEIEERASTGNGLLSPSGSSLGNLLSGDARRSLLTMSTLTVRGHLLGSNSAFYLYYLNPYNFPRALVLMAWDAVKEVWERMSQIIRNVRPRVHRGLSFLLLRAVSTVLLREMNVYILMDEMFAGVPVNYTCFVGYDVVAHHAGPTRPDAMKVLRDLDRQIERLERVAQDAPRPYHFVVLSDHGQSQGATFRQRYGQTLQKLVQSLLRGDIRVQSWIGEEKGWGHLNAVLSDAVQTDRLAGRAARLALRNLTHDGYVELGPDRKLPEMKDARVVVCGSGNLGLVYFADWPERLSLEEIEINYPGLIEGLVGHEGIGFVLVHSEKHGPLVMGKQGINYLRDGRMEGTDPLAHFGPHAADHLRRLDTFPHVGDIVLNSFYDPDTDEVAAFEEMVGSHGGLGGAQAQPFLMFPAGWEAGEEKIVGATQMFGLLSRWTNRE